MEIYHEGCGVSAVEAGLHQMAPHLNESWTTQHMVSYHYEALPFRLKCCEQAIRPTNLLFEVALYLWFVSWGLNVAF